MKLSTKTILRVILSLYKIVESNIHWFQTYHKHHMKKLKITPSIFDTYLLFNDNIITIVDLQTNDSLIADIIEFMNMKSRELHAVDLMIKSYKRLTPEQSLNFNNFIITLDKEDNIIINQTKQAKKIQLLFKSFTKKQYVVQRARKAYIVIISQSQIAFALLYAAQITKPTYKNADYLNRCLSWQLKTKKFTFVKLNVTTLRIMTFTNLSFANNKNLSSQIEYVIILTDAQNNANIIH